MASSLARLPSPLSALKRLSRRFSSSPSGPTRGSPRPSAACGGGESVAYRTSLLRRPATVRPGSVLSNSCSLIGTVVRPPQRFANRDRGAYTFLEVKGRSGGQSDDSPFQILLAMRGKLAEVSLQHLKPDDFVYVNGHLDSYEKVDISGKRSNHYKVIVKDMNYVKRSGENQTFLKADSAVAKRIAVPTSCEFSQRLTASSSASYYEEEYPDRDRDRLRLWQVFFANPFEWWDNRQKKLNPKSPDFKHKDTGEALWLSPDDPPWVRRQLQQYDSNMIGGYRRGFSGRSHDWKATDLE